MSPKYKHLVAAWALAVMAPLALAAVCGDTAVWATPADVAGLAGFAGVDDCGATVNPAEPDLTSVSLYAGARFITSDATPLPFGLRHAGPVHTSRLAVPPGDTSAAVPEAGPTSQALALLVAGFIGVSVGALRRKAV